MPIKLDHVSYTYDIHTPFETKALNDINLYIEDSSFLGITGPTGSGKSTLARILAGLLKPSQGKITSEGMCGIAFQYPENQLFEETVLKDIMFGPLNMGKTQKEAEIAARLAMAQMNLNSNLENRNPLMLSGGEKRRVAIAGILSMNPNIIILDEPAAGLDMQNHDTLFTVLSNLNKQGKTIILISHEAEDIATYCKTELKLKDGNQI